MLVDPVLHGAAGDADVSGAILEADPVDRPPAPFARQRRQCSSSAA